MNLGKPLESETVIVRGFGPGDWRDLLDIARSNAASEFAHCDETWPTDEESVKGMCAYMATDEAMSGIYAKDIGRIVCFVNLNGIDGENWLDIGHVMNLAYAGRGYEYEGLKLIYEAAFERLDIAGIRAYWALDDKAKLEPLLKLGMNVVNTYENRRFGGKEGVFTGCEMRVSRPDYALRSK